MTLKDWAVEAGQKLFVHYENKDEGAIILTFATSDALLINRKASVDDTKQFWADVHEEFFSNSFRVDEQANDALHALMTFIQTQLAARESGK